jgi:predicted transcriptional regulator
MYSLPQEIEVWYIIPAVRKELAKCLTEKHKLSFEKAGNILGISKAAVSQYLSNKRGKNFKLPEKIKIEIENSADRIFKNDKMAVSEIMRILEIIKKCKCSCSLCKKFNKGILDKCGCK